MRGRPNTAHSIQEEVKPYFSKRLQFSITNACLMWGLRVIVPPQHGEAVLHLVHEDHPGISQMKSLARLHIWWLSIDESFVKACTNCAETASNLTKVPLHQWDIPAKP